VRVRVRVADKEVGCEAKRVTHSSSNIAIIRDASGLFAICGICRNSLRSIEPEPSLCDHAKDAFIVRVLRVREKERKSFG